MCIFTLLGEYQPNTGYSYCFACSTGKLNKKDIEIVKGPFGCLNPLDLSIMP